MGYVYKDCLYPKHWFQFADDTAIVSALESDNQLLCNAYLKWSTWADLIIRVDKCHVFGMKKTKTKSVQYKPYVTLRKEPTKQQKLAKVLLTREKILILKWIQAILKKT